MSVIDELVVMVGLDPSNFEEGQRTLEQDLNKSRRSLESFGRDFEISGAKISEVFSFLRRGAAGLVAGFIGGEAASFIDKIATMDAHTGRLAHSIGMATHELSVWGNMVKEVGGNQGDADAAFAGLNDMFQQMRMGNARPSSGFARLLNTASVDWRRESPDQALMKIMESLQGQSPRDQRFWLQQIPGVGGNENMMFLLLEGMKNLAKFREEIEKWGAATKESVADAEDLQSKQAQLSTALDNLARYGFPALTFAANALLTLFKTIGAIFSGELYKAPDARAGIKNDRGFWYDFTKVIVGPKAAEETFGPSPSASTPGPPATASTGTRGDRNNNPGNVKYTATTRSYGATGQDAGGFAIFPDWDTGANAAGRLLHDQYQGLTLAQIQKRWVGNPDSSYLGQMMKSTGLGAGDVPNLNDNAVIMALIRGMMKGEGTHVLDAGSKSGGAGNKTSSVTIGSITVTSSKADPAAVADQIPDSIKRYSMLSGINTGLV
jgi:hypothetical protein